MSRFGNLEFDSGEESRLAARAETGGERNFFHRAETAFAAGKFGEALRCYAKVLEFNSGAAEAWTGQVRSLIELGEFQEARVWADKALSVFPNEPELLAAKGVALARAGDLQGAISFSDAALETRSNTPYIWLARGDVLLARKEKRADFCFERAIAVAEGNWLALWLASRIQAFYRHFARALKYAQDALSLEPARAVLWLQAGQCQMALGLATPARNSLEQARELDPDLPVQEFLNEAVETGLISRVCGRLRQWFGS
jgi:tetratricopeptide (TPR) repeat protein